MAAEKLRDLSQRIDVDLLDATVYAFYGPESKQERAVADRILQDLQSNPDMWFQVVHILQNSKSLNTKFFALQVLEGVIKYRWNELPVEQRDGVKTYISEVIVKLSRNEASLWSERLYVNKLNVILVQITKISIQFLTSISTLETQILKHEWPARWRSFIPDLVAAAKTSEMICENYMTILKLLSEEVFDFSRGEMTQQKIEELKQSLKSEFQLIHELCLRVLSTSERTELIRATLSTLHAFLSWIPLGCIFESPLLGTLLKFFPMSSYRNLTLQCLTEVAALNFGNFYNTQYVKMYNDFMGHLCDIFRPTTIPKAYKRGSSEEQAFIQNLALFFTSFYKCHIHVLESKENMDSLLMGLEYLINISNVHDIKVFKLCLEYWDSFVSELYNGPYDLCNTDVIAIMIGLKSPSQDGIDPPIPWQMHLYRVPLSNLLELVRCRMGKPEDVPIVKDENVNIVRKTMNDNDVKVISFTVEGNYIRRLLDITRQRLSLEVHLNAETPNEIPNEIDAAIRQGTSQRLSLEVHLDAETQKKFDAAIGQLKSSPPPTRAFLLSIVGLCLALVTLAVDPMIRNAANNDGKNFNIGKLIRFRIPLLFYVMVVRSIIVSVCVYNLGRVSLAQLDRRDCQGVLLLAFSGLVLHLFCLISFVPHFRIMSMPYFWAVIVFTGFCSWSLYILFMVGSVLYDRRLVVVSYFRTLYDSTVTCMQSVVAHISGCISSESYEQCLHYF